METYLIKLHVVAGLFIFFLVCHNVANSVKNRDRRRAFIFGIVSVVVPSVLVKFTREGFFDFFNVVMLIGIIVNGVAMLEALWVICKNRRIFYGKPYALRTEAKVRKLVEMLYFEKLHLDGEKKKYNVTLYGNQKEHKYCWYVQFPNETVIDILDVDGHRLNNLYEGSVALESNSIIDNGVLKGYLGHYKGWAIYPLWKR